jgi:hypothetical protein
MAYLFGKNLNQTLLLNVCFWVNLALASIYLFEQTGDRYGIDYIAYIQQAAAVYNGETDYTRLSSNLGPCFYPAGHIWHYIPAYWLHLQTEYAEYIIKFGHLVIHSLINVVVAKIAYMYFDSEHEAQLIALTMLASKETRGYYSTMYNDEIMMLYLLVAVYYQAKNCPLIASGFLTLSLSVKAGVILLIPGFLGAIQLNHGTLKLATCLIIIIGF